MCAITVEAWNNVEYKMLQVQISQNRSRVRLPDGGTYN